MSSQLLTTDGRWKTDPVFVPGTNALVYTQQESATQWVLMRLDLQSLVAERLHPMATTTEFEAAWSPDGQCYAFVRSRGNLALKLVIHHVAENRDAVFDPGGGFAGMHEPTFSPDGQRVFFSLPGAGGQQLVSVDREGRDRRAVTSGPGIYNWPSFSPDGSRLACGSSRDGNFEIYTLRPDGSDVMRLTDHPRRDVRPAWSPDGKTIAFTSHRDGYARIYTMSSDGTQLQPVTPVDESHDYVAWSLDGKSLVTVGERAGRFDLHRWER